MFKKYYMIWAYKKPEMSFMPNTMLNLIWRLTTDDPALFQIKNPGYIPTLWYQLTKRQFKQAARLLESRKATESKR